MLKLETIIRPDLLDFGAYRATANREQLGKIWLNANELAYSTHYQLNDLQLNRYPHRWPEQLLTQLAAYYHVNPNQLLLSRGSDEAIDLIIRLCCQAGRNQIMICPPTFHIYQVYATLQGAGIIRVNLTEENNFALPLTEIISQWQPTVKLIFLCSPNNPTGNLFSVEDITRICNYVEGKALVVVDEAYIEFAQAASLIEQLPYFSNLIILRTLSKAFGLAGARCGVTIATPSIIEWLRKISSPYPLPTPCITAVQAAFEEQNQLQSKEHLLQIIHSREQLQQLLILSPFITQVWPSQGNFILVRTTNAQKFTQHCLQHGIIVRDYSHEPELENCVRITIGTMSENEALLTAIAHADKITAVT